MKNKRKMLIKLIVAAFVFSGACFINTQSAKADTTLTPNKGITLKTSELKTTKVIQAPSDAETTSDNGNKASRGTISKGTKLLITHINF